jgi:hypothetical protein
MKAFGLLLTLSIIAGCPDDPSYEHAAQGGELGQSLHISAQDFDDTRARAVAVSPAVGSLEDQAGPASAAAYSGNAEGPIDKLDLLLVIDNTNSMLEEQAALQAAIPKLVQALTSGLRANGEATGFPAISDVHVGVVSTDMGIAGFELGACHADGGDDGRLQHTPHGANCAAGYPAFLSYAGSDDYGQSLANDVECVANLGTGGCGFEQSLEAPLKALTPSQNAAGDGPNAIRFLAADGGDQFGHGDVPSSQGGNQGFLRNDPASGRSLIAVVVVTDEDDCSARSSDFLAAAHDLPNDSPYRGEDINLRCHDNPTLLFDVQNRYLAGLRALRPGDEQRVVFAAIVGVPAELVAPAAISGVDFVDAQARDAFYAGILNDPRMQETVDPTTNPGSGDGNLTPSCRTLEANGVVGSALPPRRIVSLAQAFGEQGLVQSLCQADFTPAIDAIVNLIGRQVVASGG